MMRRSTTQSDNANSADSRRSAAQRSGMLAMTMHDRSGQLDLILSSAVDRLELLIDQETAALRHASAIDLKNFNNRKSQVLMELDRAMATSGGAMPSAPMKQRLGKLRDKLALNRSKLKMHLEAVQEVASMLADQIRDADSDGTYTYGIRRDGKLR